MSIKKNFLAVVMIMILSGALLTGCTDTANRKEAGQVSQQQQIYVDAQPTPTFDWSLERHLMIELYKARNNAVITYSYIRSLQGQVIFSCKSIGFPMPSNMQLTNTEAEIPGHGLTLPQAEPNGLYSSPSTSGTYVFCLNDDGTVSPSYFEADVEAHTAPLGGDGSMVTQGNNLRINTKTD